MTYKIAILAPIAWRTPPLGCGPWEQVASNITEGLVKLGYDVTLFATMDSITQARHYAICPTGYEVNKDIDPEVWKLLHISEVFERAEYFDIIHNHFNYPPLVFSKLIKTPLLTTIQGFSSEKVVPVYKKYNKHVHYVSISDADRHPELDYIDTVYNGINLKDFTFNPEGGDTLLYLGRICYEKGTSEAIQIAKKAKKRLIIAGIIQEEDYFKEKVEPFIDGEQIKYLGYISIGERNELLQNALALLNPVRQLERSGLTMIEAMACGTPVLGFDLGSVREVVAHDETGFIVKSIEEAVKSVDKLENINRDKCRQRVEQNFTVDKMVERYIDVYERVLSSKT